MKKALLSMVVLGSSLVHAAGSSYHVTLYRTTHLNGTELKSGDCKIEVIGDKALIKQGKTTVEAPVKVESNDKKFVYSTIEYSSENPDQIREIRVGGTSTVLVFGSQAEKIAASK